ncbi:fimbrial protein [Gibbsiella dentisursi]|uniref:Fimbrial protein n=1 Tax=Gibbsiella dentisursi TaxID=796890 RepID=A0ABP7M7S0_9GAMM
MNKIITKSILVAFFLFVSNTCTAASLAESKSATLGYTLISNEVDGEYFLVDDQSGGVAIFSGANTWTKHSSYGTQTLLGYLGTQSWYKTSEWTDIYLENSPIRSPFLGIICPLGDSGCPSSGYITGSATDENGFYHAMSASTVGGAYARATLSSSAYDYFLGLKTGSTETYNFIYCYVPSLYASEYATYDGSKKCMNLSDGVYNRYAFKVTKNGQITINDVGAQSTVYTTADGSPTIMNGNDLCYEATVDSKNGIVCKMVSYTYDYSTLPGSYLNIYLGINTADIGGFDVGTSDILWSADASTWYKNGSSNKKSVSKVFSSGSGYLYVFLTPTFFKELVNSGYELSSSDNAFVFSFYNTNRTGSGYYEFTSSNSIKIVPKEYGVSITASDGSRSTSGTGTIGSSTPISMDYDVVVSGPAQFTSVTAAVSGSMVSSGGSTFCAFTGNDITVPIPQYLEYKNSSGITRRMYTNCDSSKTVDLTDAEWTQTAWTDYSGYYWKTTISLDFPMNNSVSKTDTDGSNWEGTVSANGTITVTATWEDAS